MDNLTREMRLCERAGFGVSYGKWKATQPIKEMPKKQEARTCLYCGKPIINCKRDLGRRYCDNDCSAAAYKKRTQQKRIPVEKKCEWCGKAYIAKKSNHRFCCNNCGAKQFYYRKRDRLEAEKARND